MARGGRGRARGDARRARASTRAPGQPHGVRGRGRRGAARRSVAVDFRGRGGVRAVGGPRTHVPAAGRGVPPGRGGRTGAVGEATVGGTVGRTVGGGEGGRWVRTLWHDRGVVTPLRRRGAPQACCAQCCAQLHGCGAGGHATRLSGQHGGPCCALRSFKGVAPARECLLPQLTQRIVLF